MKVIHFVLNRVLRKNIKLHPDEHTHVSAQHQTIKWLLNAGLDVVSFYFGSRDLFTHQIIVAEKPKPKQPDPEKWTRRR